METWMDLDGIVLGGAFGISTIGWEGKGLLLSRGEDELWRGLTVIISQLHGEFYTCSETSGCPELKTAVGFYTSVLSRHWLQAALEGSTVSFFRQGNSKGGKRALRTELCLLAAIWAAGQISSSVLHQKDVGSPSEYPLQVLKSCKRIRGAEFRVCLGNTGINCVNKGLWEGGMMDRQVG